MAFTAADVKKLREMTNVGMMDCKKALTASDGDMDKAVEWLREKGLAKAAKKAGRIAAEGMAYATVCEKCGVGAMVEVNCETDFCAKSAPFVQFVKDICQVVLENNPADVEAIKDCTYPGTELKVSEVLPEKVMSIGENLQIRRFARFVPEHGIVDTYNHMGGRIGVMVELSCPEVNDEVKALSHDLVMHIAAANPQFVRRDEVPTDNLEKEREVLTQQALNEGKAAKIVERMVEGRIEKYYKEVCLLEQPFVKDSDKSIKQVMAETAKEIGANIDIVRFERFERGEGIEKRQDNFAEEIAAQMAAKA